MSDLRTDPQSVPGLEARHEWDGGALILNDMQGALPRFRCSSIDGLHSRADMEDHRDRLTGRIGEVARNTLLGGRTIIYRGDPTKMAGLQAATLASMRYRAGLARQVFSVSDERTMRIIPHPTYGGSTYKYKGRVLLWECPEEQTVERTHRPSPWLRPFTLSIRQSDPRYYIDGSLATVTSPFHAAGNTISKTVTNGGFAHVDPTVRLYGPATGPKVRRIIRDGAGAEIAGAAQLVFADTAVISAGKYLEINFATRSVRYDPPGANTDWQPQIVAASTSWWNSMIEGLPAGDSDWVMWGVGGFTGATKFDVTFEKAVW